MYTVELHSMVDGNNCMGRYPTYAKAISAICEKFDMGGAPFENIGAHAVRFIPPNRLDYFYGVHGEIADNLINTITIVQDAPKATEDAN